jgi:hypothetical protein
MLHSLPLGASAGPARAGRSDLNNICYLLVISAGSFSPSTAAMRQASVAESSVALPPVSQGVLP